MSWKEIMMTVNSDITKPLNNLISELSDEQVVLLNNVLDKLNNISTGGGTGSSGNKPFYTSGFEKNIISNKFISLSTLPYDFYQGSAVVYNNEIHILGSNNSTAHYKWNGTSWTSVSTLPYIFRGGSTVVYNNEIHILGSSGHYKWDGTSWTSVSTIPYTFYDSSAVVYNNEIHIMGSGNSNTYYKYHYKWDGTSWTKVSTLPYPFYQGSAVVYNNEIHIMGTGYNIGSYYTAHYKWDGTSWIEVSTLPYDFYNGSAVVYNNEIHILGSSSGDYRTKHYKWDGTSWTSVSTLPYDFYYGSAVIYNNEIHILGSGDGNTKHYNLITKYLCYIYLPSGSIIYFYDSRISSIIEKTNCTKQLDGSLLVNSDGLVEFEVTDNTGIIDTEIEYSIF